MRKRCITLLSIFVAILIASLVFAFYPRLEVQAKGTLSISVKQKVNNISYDITGLNVGDEVISAKTATSKTKYLGTALGGKHKFSIDSSTNLQSYKDNLNNWHDINPRLIQQGTKYVSLDTPYLIEYTGLDRRIYPNRYDLTKYIDFVCPARFKALPLTYSNTSIDATTPNYDFHFGIGNQGDYFTLIFKTAPNFSSVTFNITAVGLDINALLSATNGLGIPKPHIIDSSIPPKESVIDWVYNSKKGELTYSFDLTGLTYPITIADAIDVQVGASADDGRRYTGSMGFATDATGSYVGYFNNSLAYHCHYFARFTNLTFSGTIDTSYIQLSAYSTSGTPELKVYCVDEDNAAAPTSSAEFDADPLTTAGVDWDGVFNIGDAWNQSPSLNSPLQELINTYTISGDAVMFQVKNDKAGTGTNFNGVNHWDRAGNVLGAKLHIEYTAGGDTYDITNAPSTKAFGIVAASTTYYAGSAPADPVADGTCTYTLTDTGSAAVDVDVHGHAFIGGVGWTLTSGAPGENTVRIYCYHTGDSPANYVTLTTSDQELISNLASSAHIHWDFSLNTGTFTDGAEKTGIITLTSRAVS